MYDRHFFASKLGLAALVSVAMMVSFNVYALNLQFGAATAVNHVGAPVIGSSLVELA